MFQIHATLLFCFSSRDTLYSLIQSDGLFYTPGFLSLRDLGQEDSIISFQGMREA